jgi:hypothetical protein
LTTSSTCGNFERISENRRPLFKEERAVEDVDISVAVAASAAAGAGAAVALAVVPFVALPNSELGATLRVVEVDCAGPEIVCLSERL